MISKIHPGLSILLILAMLFSFTAVVMPAAPVQAAATTAVISAIYGGTNTANTGPAYVSSTASGIVTVKFQDSQSEYCQLYMVQGSGSPISGQSGTVTAGVDNVWMIPATSANAGYYDVYVQAGGLNSAISANAVYIDNTTPSVSIYTDTTCVTTDNSFNVHWTATIPNVPNEKFSSVDIQWQSGSVHTYTNQAQTTTGSYTWTSPHTPDFGYFTINATSYSGKTATFTYPPNGAYIYVMSPSAIVAATPSVTPSTGLACGSSATIKFTETGLQAPNFTYLLTLNPGNGTPAQYITPGYISSSTAAVTYPWTVPSMISTTNATISVMIKDCAGNTFGAFTSSVFAITCSVTPTVTVTSPVASTVWYTGTSENVTWTVNDPASSETHSCTVYYSTTDNTTWPWTNVATLTAQGNSGSNYWATWSIPTSAAGTRSEIMVETAGIGSNPAGRGYSSVYTINQITTMPTVTIVYPLATYSWTAGTTQNISWKATGTPTTTPMDYKIYLYQNGSPVTSVSGSGDGLIVALNSQAQCSSACGYAWTIPTALSSGIYNIKVVASYLVGPGPQEQLPIQKDSDNFNIIGVVTPCATTQFSVDLYPGWNFISLQAIPENSAISNVLSDVMSDVIAVYYWTGGTSGSWISYIPATGNGTLTTIVDGKGYWVQMKQTYTHSQFHYYGRKCPCGGGSALNPYMTLVGWNMIGFKSTVSQDVDEYLPYTCGTSYAAPIYSYNGSAQEMTSLSCTDSMETGKGYWVYFGSVFGINPGCK